MIFHWFVVICRDLAVVCGISMLPMTQIKETSKVLGFNKNQLLC